MQQESVRATVEAVVEDLMLRVEERLWDEDKGRLITASRELSRAKTMIDDLESRVMVRDTSIAALQKEVQDSKHALTVSMFRMCYTSELREAHNASGLSA